VIICVLYNGIYYHNGIYLKEYFIVILENRVDDIIIIISLQNRDEYNMQDMKIRQDIIAMHFDKLCKESHIDEFEKYCKHITNDLTKRNIAFNGKEMRISKTLPPINSDKHQLWIKHLYEETNKCQYIHVLGSFGKVSLLIKCGSKKIYLENDNVYYYLGYSANDVIKYLDNGCGNLGHVKEYRDPYNIKRHVIYTNDELIKYLNNIEKEAQYKSLLVWNNSEFYAAYCHIIKSIKDDNNRSTILNQNHIVDFKTQVRFAKKIVSNDILEELNIKKSDVPYLFFIRVVNICYAHIYLESIICVKNNIKESFDILNPHISYLCDIIKEFGKYDDDMANNIDILLYNLQLILMSKNTAKDRVELTIKILNKYPQLLNLIKVLFETSGGKIYARDSKSNIITLNSLRKLPDIGLLYSDMIKSLKKCHGNEYA